MKIPKIVQDELDKCNLAVRAVDGGCHTKIYVDEKFVGIVPKNARKDDRGGRGGLNMRANIRRLAREKANTAGCRG